MALLIIFIAGIVVVAILFWMALAYSAQGGANDVLRALDEKGPLNVSGLVKATGKSRRIVIHNLLVMGDKGFVRTDARGGMKSLANANNRTTFFITSAGRRKVRGEDEA